MKGRGPVWAAVFLFVLVVCASSPRPAHAQSPNISEVIRVGPWPALSRLVGYRGKLWFVNSVRYPDHNSADLYSYDLTTQTVRFERPLFSQDAGAPVVADGLLYWPFEDARPSMGWGHVAVSNGENWALRIIPAETPVFHTHAMEAVGGRLYAATSAWATAVHVSSDQGLTWKKVFEDKSPDRYVHRIVDLKRAGNRVYGALKRRTADGERWALLDIKGEQVGEVKGWPDDGDLWSMTAIGERLYLLVGRGGPRGNGLELWRLTDSGPERVLDLNKNGLRFVGLAASKSLLWAISRHEDGNGGALWSSDNGLQWTLYGEFRGGEPGEVVIYAGRAFIAGRGENGNGILWMSHNRPRLTGQKPPSPIRRRAVKPANWQALSKELESALKKPENFKSHGRPLRPILYPAMTRKPPGTFFSRHLFAPFPEGPFEAFGGQIKVKGNRLGQWVLLWAMGVSQTGRVPLKLLDKPWDETDNNMQKWFHPTPMALFAVRWLGQDDTATLRVLKKRLALKNDPDWLKQNIKGTILVLEGSGPNPDSDFDLVAIPGGKFTMGDAAGEPDEKPATVTVAPFRIMRREVTNAQFKRFVGKTGHVTDVEKSGSGWVWRDKTWQQAQGVNWRRPHNKNNSIDGRHDHPVVQVSKRDAEAFCRHYGMRLPSEKEWEFAARGQDGRRFPWGNEPPTQSGVKRANFGTVDCCAPDDSDGYEKTAPVGSYPAGRSPFGLDDMAGNVWEWTRDLYKGRSGVYAIRGSGWGNNPYCLRVSYRHGNARHFGLDMVGFRCAADTD